MSAPPGIGPWADLPFFAEAWPDIRSALSDDTRQILPAEDRIFAALATTPPERVRVVLLGQDPYPTPGHAIGLAFAVAREVALPRSLKNIFKELQADIGAAPTHGDLTHWAAQGVLLLNTALTVPAGEAGGHAKLGWERLAGEVIAHVSARPTAFLLWGGHARKMARHIQGEGHLIVESAHPSPLSAARGFFGSRPFSRINQWLEARGEDAIDWAGPGG